MTDNTDIRLTVDAWSEIVISNWLDRIEKLGVQYSFQLEESLLYELIGNSGGLPERIEFSFNYYGKFVDMGVGRGVKLDQVKFQRMDGGRRRPKTWYSKVMYGQMQRLREIMQQKYARIGTLVIYENIDDNALRWTPEKV